MSSTNKEYSKGHVPRGWSVVNRGSLGDMQVISNQMYRVPSLLTPAVICSVSDYIIYLQRFLSSRLIEFTYYPFTEMGKKNVPAFKKLIVIV